MSNAQSMLTLAALMILSIANLSFYTNALENSTMQIENKVSLTAFSLADDLIEEIKVRAFDEKTQEFPVANPSALTIPAALGPDYGEVYPNFDDMDDFNGYVKKVSLPHAENYFVKCRIFYVNSTNPDLPAIAQTFYKKAHVVVSSPYMKSPVELAFIFTHK